MKKNILACVTAGSIMLIVGMLTGQLFQVLFPSIKLEYTNTGLFREWADPLMSLVFATPFVMAFVLTWLWSITKGTVKGGNAFEKGLNFGFMYWIIGIPGMLISYATFPVSTIMILSWSMQTFVQVIIAGIVFSRMLK